MTVVSTKEFNNNQKKYFSKAISEEVFIKRGKNRFHLLFHPKVENGFLEPEKMEIEKKTVLRPNPQLVRKVKQAEGEYKKGNYVRITNPNDLWNSLNI